MLGTADIIAQMADRCYLEKCRDRLYPEFVLGGLAKKKLPGGRTQILFRSGDDLVRKTPGFYMNAAKRLDLQLARAYEYAERHFERAEPLPRGNAEERALRAGGERRPEHGHPAPPAALDAEERRASPTRRNW